MSISGGTVGGFVDIVRMCEDGDGKEQRREEVYALQVWCVCVTSGSESEPDTRGLTALISGTASFDPLSLVTPAYRHHVPLIFRLSYHPP